MPQSPSREKAFNLSPVIMLAMAFTIDVHNQIEDIPPIPGLLRNIIVNGYLILPNAFP